MASFSEDKLTTRVNSKKRPALPPSATLTSPADLVSSDVSSESRLQPKQTLQPLTAGVINSSAHDGGDANAALQSSSSTAATPVGPRRSNVPPSSADPVENLSIATPSTRDGKKSPSLNDFLIDLNCELDEKDSVNGVGMDNLSLAEVLTDLDNSIIDLITSSVRRRQQLANTATSGNGKQNHDSPLTPVKTTEETQEQQKITSSTGESMPYFVTFKGDNSTTTAPSISQSSMWSYQNVGGIDSAATIGGGNVTPGQLRKNVTFCNDVQTYSPSYNGAGWKTVYSSTGSRFMTTSTPSSYGYPMTSSASAVQRAVCTTSVTSAREVRNQSDRNLYDDVEVRPKTDDVINVAADENVGSRAEVGANNTVKVNTDSINNNNNDAVDDVIQKSKGPADHRLQRTVALMWCWLLAGVFSGLLGSSLYSWRVHYQVSYEELTRAFVVEGFGTAFGAVVYSGLATTCLCLHGDGLIGIAMFFMAFYPCYPSFLYLVASSFVFGIAKGFLFVGSLCIIKQQWDSRLSALCIHLLYISMAIGCFISLHIGPQYMAQILVLTTSGKQCGSFSSMSRQVSNVSADDSSGTSNYTSCVTFQQQQQRNIRFPVIHIPLTLTCVCLAVFLWCLSVSACCENRRHVSSTVHRRPRRPRPTRTKRKGATRQIHTVKNSSAENAYVTETFEQLARDKINKPVQQTNVNDGQQSNYETMTSSEKSGKLTSSKNCETTITPKKTEISKPVVTAAKKLSSPWFQREQVFDVPILMFLYVFHMIPYGLELALGRFLFIYAGRNRLLQTNQISTASLEQSSLSSDSDVYGGTSAASHSLLLVSLFWGSLILGRFLSLCIGSFLFSPLLLTLSSLTVQLISAALLSAYGNQFLLVLWLLVAGYGFALGPVSPGSWTWADLFLTSNPRSVAIGVASAAVSGSLLTWLTGLGVDYYGTRSTWLVAAGAGLLSVIFSIPVVLKLNEHRVRIQTERRRQRQSKSTYV